MYDLPHFKEHNRDFLLQFMRSHPFALLCGVNPNNVPVATQVPLLIDESGDTLKMHGHMMRKSDHHLALEKNPNVLCVFTGAHTYVSATWYSNPHQASTWNYMSVHAHGRIRFLDEQSLIDILRKTTMHFEGNNDASTTVFDNLPEAYTAPLVKGIVGFEVTVHKLENVFKLSQNRDQESYRNIVQHLGAMNADEKTIADEMKKREDELYKSS